MEFSRLLRIAARVAATQIKRELQWWQGCCPPPPEEAPKYWREDIPSDVYKKIWEEKHATTIKWTAPNIEADREKFHAIAESLGLDVADIQSKISRGFLDKLSPQVWALLANSDSWAIESMEEAEMRAALRDEDLQPILDAISAGQTIPAPIVLILGDGTPHLVSGNDRLMVARAMDTEVKVFFVDMASSPESHQLAEMPVTGYRR